MIDYQIKDEGSYSSSIKHIKERKEGFWVQEAAEKEVELVLTYAPNIVKSFKVHALKAPIVHITFLNKGKEVNTFTEKTIRSLAQWEADSKVYFEKEGIDIKESNEAQIRLINDSAWNLKMGLHFVCLNKDRSNTPIKDNNPRNLSSSQEFKSSGQKLQSASKSPHAALYKNRERNPTQREEFRVQTSLKEAVLNKKRTQSEQEEQLERVMRLSKEQHEMLHKPFNKQLDEIEEETTILCTSNVKDVQSTEKDMLREPSQKMKYSRGMVDKRQLALLGMLNKQMKMLQRQAEISAGVPENERISSLISNRPFNGQIFVLSGYEGKAREELAQRAKQIGMKYSHDLCNGCYLVAAFTNTPKFNESKKFSNVIVVNHSYINDCFAKKQRLPLMEKYIQK